MLSFGARLYRRVQWGVIAGCCAFASLRLIFGFYVGEPWEASEIGTPIMHYNIALLPLAVEIVYKGAALVIASGFLSCLRPRVWRFAMWVGVALVPGTLISLLVWDLCRSLAYLFPVLLLCTKRLIECGDDVLLRRVSLLAAAGSVLLPTYNYWMGSIDHFASITKLIPH